MPLRERCDENGGLSSSTHTASPAEALPAIVGLHDKSAAMHANVINGRIGFMVW
jgi:hypothetical protein